LKNIVTLVTKKILGIFLILVSANISKEADLLVKFSVNKTVFTLGDVIKGTFDFSQGTIPCYQV
jgi:hypothetical protein